MLLASRLRGILLATSLFSLLDVVRAEYVDPTVLDACPGYQATDVQVSGPTLTAKLVLAGAPCNVFGNDTKTLDLAVTYETGS
jgi:alpha-glucosidase